MGELLLESFLFDWTDVLFKGGKRRSNTWRSGMVIFLKEGKWGFDTWMMGMDVFLKEGKWEDTF